MTPSSLQSSHHLRRRLTLGAAFGIMLACCLPAHAERMVVPRPDGSLIVAELQRPADGGRVPLVLAIEGSLCIPFGDDEVFTTLAREPRLQHHALLVVEKPDPTVPVHEADGSVSIGPEFRCSDEFKTRYTLEQRVLDHLATIAHLRRSADWWNGQLLIWGFSDGARIASRVGVFVPETQRMVLIGLGGGRSMAEDLLTLMCPEQHAVPTCREEFIAQTSDIRAHPVADKTWLGDANTYAAWASRLDAVEANVLQDATFPILLVHGDRDGSVPVDSARALAARLGRPRGMIDYREVSGMAHGLGIGLSDDAAAQVRERALSWLLESDH